MQYAVTATRWEKGWELEIEGVGVTQSHTLEDADEMARDLISRRLDVPYNSFDVIVTPKLGDEELSKPAARDLAAVERTAAQRVSRGAWERLRDALTGFLDVVASHNTHSRR
jgi:hypothetical protein